MPTQETSTAAADPVLGLLRLMHEVSATFSIGVREVLAELDLSETDGGVLWLLDPDGPAMRMREIAQNLGCDPSNVTLIGDKLERAGLVSRQAHPQDRRARVLVLTAAGSRLRTRLLARLVAATSLSTLTAREQQQLGHLLAKVAGRA